MNANQIINNSAEQSGLSITLDGEFSKNFIRRFGNAMQILQGNIERNPNAVDEFRAEMRAWKEDAENE